MRKRNKYKPYIRKANGKEKSGSYLVAYQIANFSFVKGTDFYVMVQHGFPNKVICVGASKFEIKRKLLAYNNSKDFDKYANFVKRGARGW